MKKILIIIFIALFILAGGSWLFLHLYNKSTERDQAVTYYRLTPEEKALLRDGDIILRHGFGFVSDMIVEQLDEQYDISHCAILCKDTNELMIIHSVSSSISPHDGVQSQDFDPFIRDSHYNSVIVVRYRSGNDSADNSGISLRAREYLKKEIPFDHGFDLEDTSEFYCSELLWKCILNEYHDDIFLDHRNERKDHMRFDIFLDTSRFEIVLNHHLKKDKESHSFQNLSARNLRNFKPVSQ